MGKRFASMREAFGDAMVTGWDPSLDPRDLATILGRAGVPGFADELLRLMAALMDGV